MEITLQVMQLQKEKSIVQSLQTITLRNNFGIYCQRCILLLCEATQYLFEGKSLSGKIKYSFEKGIFDDLRITFPIQAIDPEVTNYEQIRGEIKKLVTIPVHYETKEKKVDFAFLSAIEYRKQSGNITITLRDEVAEALLDFSKGFRRIELNTALSIRLSYSLRFYQLLKGQTTPIKYSLDELKKILGLEKKYNTGGVHSFIKKVLEPARQNLIDQNIPSFDFKPYYDETSGGGKRGRKPIKGFIFTAWPDSTSVDDSIMRKYGGFLFPALSQGVKNYLMHSLGFSERSIKNNQALLERAQLEISDFMGFLHKLRNNAISAKNPTGYAINAIKSELSKKVQTEHTGNKSEGAN